MRVISLTQPWASAIYYGFKRIETRSWPTTYRGPLAIHAAKGFAGFTKADRLDMAEEEPFQSLLVKAGVDYIDDLPRGVLLCVVDLVDCFEFTPITTEHISTRERAFGNFDDGRYGFTLANLRRLPQPIPLRGQLGIRPLPADIEREVRAHLKEVV